MAFSTKKKTRLPLVLIISALLLLPILAGVIIRMLLFTKGVAPHNEMGRDPLYAKHDVILTRDLVRIAEEGDGIYAVPQEFLDDISDSSRVLVQEFHPLAETHGLSQQYVQRFTKDAFVYRAGAGFAYIPVDFSLKQSSIDWGNLVHEADEKRYLINGEPRAVKAIDVSTHQGDINWDRVQADGVEAAYIRLGYRGYTKGGINLDDKFVDNIQGAQAAGIQVGVYFYSQAITEAEALEEARFVLEAIDGYDLDLPIAFDMEGGENPDWRTHGLDRQIATDIAKAFLSEVEDAGFDAVLYSFAQYLTNGLDLAQLQDYPIWLAQYYYVPFFPYDIRMWQYTSQGSVAGINAPVDLNLMFL